MNTSLAWLMLVASGLIDVAWAYATKRSEGMTHLGWSALSLGLLAAFITLLSSALRVLPLGTAYGVWTGIGALGSLAVGIVLLGEPVAAARIVFALITLVGIVGLKASG
ncbi:SMR family transporter [Caulobacter sp. 1776]|uniref:DMT family transporter n=1 Tax=Caulobacter sp. 1776 TaxID=3156420 RepID=UPI0033937D57